MHDNAVLQDSLIVFKTVIFVVTHNKYIYRLIVVYDSRNYNKMTIVLPGSLGNSRGETSVSLRVLRI